MAAGQEQPLEPIQALNAQPLGTPAGGADAAEPAPATAYNPIKGATGIVLPPEPGEERHDGQNADPNAPPSMPPPMLPPAYPGQ